MYLTVFVEEQHFSWTAMLVNRLTRMVDILGYNSLQRFFFYLRLTSSSYISLELCSNGLKSRPMLSRLFMYLTVFVGKTNFIAT